MGRCYHGVFRGSAYQRAVHPLFQGIEQQKAADIYESLTKAALECILDYQLGSMMQEHGTQGQIIALHGAVASPIDSPPMPAEQRTRFLMRLLTSHVDAVSDCELLELILSSAPCTVDANALAILGCTIHKTVVTIVVT